jgi:hypothetical protein
MHKQLQQINHQVQNIYIMGLFCLQMTVSFLSFYSFFSQAIYFVITEILRPFIHEAYLYKIEIHKSEFNFCDFIPLFL